ncbi:MAG: transketolase C-terminal domain-containing protein, partial [Balneolales bacterium]
RAGLAGADGPTHHGLFDIAYFRCIPNIVVSAPMNEVELRDLMFTASNYSDQAFAIRYPRGSAVGLPLPKDFKTMEIGKGECLREGDDVAILSYGTIGKYAIQAADSLAEEGINVGHYNMRFVKPLDTELIDQITHKYTHIITIEDGTRHGGFGSAVAEYTSEKDIRPKFSILGVPDQIIEHGTQEELHKETGLDADGIISAVKKAIGVEAAL